MSTFFQQTAQAMITKHIGRFPLLKLDQVIDWQPIEQYFRYARSSYFGLLKVSAQSHLKVMCLNLLKAANRLSGSVAA